MSVDERLRRALEEQADSFLPSVETALDRVSARGRVARWRGAAVATTASAAAVAAIAAGLVLLEQSGENAPPVERPTASASGTTSNGPLRGPITGVVERPAELAGRWMVQLNGNGTMDVTPPPDFDGDISGALFSADSSSFRTTLFQDDVCSGHGTGIYSWLEFGTRIDFQLVSDTCEPRSRFFEDSAWSVSTTTGPGG